MTRLVPIVSSLAVAALLLASSHAGAAEDDVKIRVLGEARRTEDAVAVIGKSAAVVLQGLEGGASRLTVELLLAAEPPKGIQAAVLIAPNEPGNLKQPALARFDIQRGSDKGGQLVGLWPSSFDPTAKQWKKCVWTQVLNYKEDWKGRWLQLQVDFRKRSVAVWFEGLLVEEYERPQGTRRPWRCTSARATGCGPKCHPWTRSTFRSTFRPRPTRGSRNRWVATALLFSTCPSGSSRIRKGA